MLIAQFVRVMAELVVCETHTAVINRFYEWAVDDEFPRRLIRAIRTRLDQLTDSRAAFLRAHSQLLAGVPMEKDRSPRHQRYMEAEEIYLHALELLNVRFYEADDIQNNVVDLDERDSQNGVNASFHASDDDSQNQKRGAEINASNSAPEYHSVLQVTQQAPASDAPPWQRRFEDTRRMFEGNYTNGQHSMIVFYMRPAKFKQSRCIVNCNRSSIYRKVEQNGHSVNG